MEVCHIIKHSDIYTGDAGDIVSLIRHVYDQSPTLRYFGQQFNCIIGGLSGGQGANAVFVVATN